MEPYFYSLGMLVTGRMVEQPYLSAMGLLAAAIADEEKPPHQLIAFLFKEPK